MRTWWIALTIGTLSLAGAVSWSLVAQAFRPAARREGSPNTGRRNPRLLSAGHAATTSRTELDRTVAAMETRLKSDAADAPAAIALADALLRQTRVTGNAGLASRAASALKAALADEPMDYGARRMLAAVFLSQHRFHDAIREA